MTWQCHCGDARGVLETLAAGSVQTCITSPPYWGLRNYGVDGQLGREATPAAYVAALVAVFAAVRRVLRDDGTLWLNLGDSYAAGGNGVGSGKQLTNVGSWLPRKDAPAGFKPKDLIGIPWRVAFALQADGWYLRSDVVWAKPDPMPESVTDRPTKAHEYVFLLSKAPRYYWDAAAIAEPTQSRGTITFGGAGKLARCVDGEAPHGNEKTPARRTNYETRNVRSVWPIATDPSPYEHFAVMPKALARRCVRAGAAPEAVVLDPFAGVCTTGVVALEEGRSFVGVELSPTYHAMGRARLEGTMPLFACEAEAPAVTA